MPTERGGSVATATAYSVKYPHAPCGVKCVFFCVCVRGKCFFSPTISIKCSTEMSRMRFKHMFDKKKL